MTHTVSPLTVAVVGMAIGFGILDPAAANPIDKAQAYVIDQTTKGTNILSSGCSALSSNNGKNICALKDPNSQSVLVGFINNRSSDKVKSDYKTLKTLNAWNVASAIVGSTFIEPLPCRGTDHSPFTCGGFTEQRLSGSEIRWADYEQELITGQTAQSCSSSAYTAKIAKAYDSVAVLGGKATLPTLVADKDENWREELTGDVTSMGQSFMRHKAAVVDLQAFIQADGNMFVFDAEGLNVSENFYTCWSKALIGLSNLILHQK